MSDDFQQRGGSPWGRPPGGGGGNGSGRGPTPPDIDKIIREFQEKIKKFLPGGSSSGGKQAILVLLILQVVTNLFCSAIAFNWLISRKNKIMTAKKNKLVYFFKIIAILFVVLKVEFNYLYMDERYIDINE